MGIEIPDLKRCCCCLPLRYGLLVWSYLLLIPLMYHVHEYISTLLFFIDRNFEIHWTTATFYPAGFLLLVANIGLTFLFIVAAHKKSIRLLKMYYKFAFFSSIATFLVELLWFVNIMVYYWYVAAPLMAWKQTLLWLFIGVMSFGVKLYVLVMVRSEILKLDKNYKFQFSNIAAEAENAYYEPNIITNELENTEETNESTIEKRGDEDGVLSG